MTPYIQIKLTDCGFDRVSDNPLYSCLNIPHVINSVSYQNALNEDRSDLFSLGCILYYLLYGNYPIGRCETIEEIITHMKENEVEELSCAHFDDPRFFEVIYLIESLKWITPGHCDWEDFKNDCFTMKSIRHVNKLKSEIK